MEKDLQKEIEAQRKRLKVRVVNREVEGIKGVVVGVARNLVVIDSLFIEGVTSSDRKEVEKFVHANLIEKGALDQQIKDWRKIGLGSKQIPSSPVAKKEKTTPVSTTPKEETKATTAVSKEKKAPVMPAQKG